MRVRSGRFCTTLLTAFVLSVSCAFVSAQQLPNTENGESTGVAEIDLLKPNRGTASADLTKSLIKTTSEFAIPELRKNSVPVPIDVTTESTDARNYARQGFGLLQSNWDFESHRCFIKAIESDPNCLPAYSGLLIQAKHKHSLSSPYFSDLIGKVQELKISRNGKEYKYTAQERLYADLALAIAEEDSEERTEVFINFKKKYPVDFYAHVIDSVILTTRGMKERENHLENLMRRYRFSPLLWSTWVNVHLTTQTYNAKQMEEKVLPIVEKIIRWEGEDALPVWHLRKGRVLRKMNKLTDAEAAFNKASEMFIRWGKENKIPLEYNDGFWKAQMFKVSTLYELGEFDQAMKLAKELQATKINPLVQSEVRGIYLWEVQTLPTRLYIARAKEGDLKLALEALPKNEFLSSIEKESAAAMYCGGLFEYVAILNELKKGNVRKAQTLRDGIAKRLDDFNSTVAEFGDSFADKNYLLRGKKTLDAYAYHCHGLIEYRLMKDKDNFQKALEVARTYSKQRANMAEMPQQVLSDWAQ